MSRIHDILQKTTQPAQVESAITQAQRDVEAGRLDAQLQALVANGKMTQARADQYKQWWQTMPSMPSGLGLPGMGGMGRGMRGMGGPPPDSSGTTSPSTGSAN